jgi:hypothetical protein
MERSPAIGFFRAEVLRGLPHKRDLRAAVAAGGYVSLDREGESRFGQEASSSYFNNLNREGLIREGERLDEVLCEASGLTRGMNFVAEVLRVRTREGGVASLAANAVQRQFESRRGTRNIVLKARQMGLTTWVAARFFMRTITRPGTLTVQVAHTREAAEEIFRIVHRFYQWLGEDLRKGPLKTSRANARQLIFPEMDSQFRVESAADRNAGRGMTAQNLHCSELARWPADPAETLAGLRATLGPGAEMVLESTPMGMGGCFYQEWHRAPETGLVRHFYPWWKEERYVAAPADVSTYTVEERELADREGLTPEQIGYRRQIRANFGSLAKQEYAEDADNCFSTSGECYFDSGTIAARLKEVSCPYRTRYNGELEIWLPPSVGNEYVVAVDPAGGGTAGDYSAMVVLELKTGVQCAEFAGHVGGLDLARRAAELASEYNNAWLVVERNNHGSGVLAYLDSDCRYGRIYEENGQAGWLTSSRTRPAALANLGSALAHAPQRFQSARFLEECRSFVRLPKGGMAALPGTHDDRVMAMAIALAVRSEILNLKNREALVT